MKRYKFIVVSKGEIPLGYLEEDPEGDLAADTAEDIERLELIIQQYKEDSEAMSDNYTEALAEIERLKAEVDAALAYGYEYYKNPSMRGSSLHACRLAWKEWMVLAHENN